MWLHVRCSERVLRLLDEDENVDEEADEDVCDAVQCIICCCAVQYCKPACWATHYCAFIMIVTTTTSTTAIIDHFA